MKVKMASASKLYRDLEDSAQELIHSITSWLWKVSQLPEEMVIGTVPTPGALSELSEAIETVVWQYGQLPIRPHTPADRRPNLLGWIFDRGDQFPGSSCTEILLNLAEDILSDAHSLSQPITTETESLVNEVIRSVKLHGVDPIMGCQRQLDSLGTLIADELRPLAVIVHGMELPEDDHEYLDAVKSAEERISAWLRTNAADGKHPPAARILAELGGNKQAFYDAIRRMSVSGQFKGPYKPRSR